MLVYEVNHFTRDYTLYYYYDYYSSSSRPKFNHFSLQANDFICILAASRHSRMWFTFVSFFFIKKINYELRSW